MIDIMIEWVPAAILVLSVLAPKLFGRTGTLKECIAGFILGSVLSFVYVYVLAENLSTATFYPYHEGGMGGIMEAVLLVLFGLFFFVGIIAYGLVSLFTRKQENSIWHEAVLVLLVAYAFSSNFYGYSPDYFWTPSASELILIVGLLSSILGVAFLHVKKWQHALLSVSAGLLIYFSYNLTNGVLQVVSFMSGINQWGFLNQFASYGLLIAPIFSYFLFVAIISRDIYKQKVTQIIAVKT